MIGKLKTEPSRTQTTALRNKRNYMAKRDYYEVLGVIKTASVTEIKGAYRKAAMAHHPDRNPGNKEAEEKFKECSEAYEVLSSEEKRRVYDQFGHQGLSGQGFQGFRDVEDVFSSFGSIFEDFFGFGGQQGGRGRGGVRRGADLRYDMQITFEEAVKGVQKDIEFERAGSCKTCSGSGAKPGTKRTSCKTCGGAGQVRRNQGFFSLATTCPSCGGEGTTVSDPCTSCKGRGAVLEKKNLNIKIPAGVETGLRLRVAGEGEGGAAGGPAGDLYVILHVEESDIFQREENDLIVNIHIGIAQAALGCKVKVPTLDGDKSVDLPAGAQPGQRITLPGLGVPSVRGIGKGDLHIDVNVVVPKRLSKEQKEILQKYAEVSREETGDGGSGFFQKIFSGDR